MTENRIEIIKGDITKIKAHAIVNAANSSLMPGGGVCGAIHAAGGRSIMEECRKIVDRQGGCKTGEAVITGAGKLPAKFVIHTVGPIWNGGKNNEAFELRNCYLNSLQLAVDNNCKIISFPAISTGIYGYPKNDAAAIALSAVSNFLASNLTIEKIWLVCFDHESFNILTTEQKKTR